jgi:hypothetical protein
VTAAAAAAPLAFDANITWDEPLEHARADARADAQVHEQVRTGVHEEEEMLRVALEVSLQEEQERVMAASLREEEVRQKARLQEKFGLVQSRLRLMRHPSEPLVETWLKLLEQCLEGVSTPVPYERRQELEAWLEKRVRSSPIWSVLQDLL